MNLGRGEVSGQLLEGAKLPICVFTARKPGAWLCVMLKDRSSDVYTVSFLHFLM